MAVNVRLLIDRKQAESAITTQYTTDDLAKVVIDKFTATNISSDAVSISVYLPNSAESADDENRVVKDRVIAAGETYTFPEISGQIIQFGGKISTIASSASSLVISASGREIT